MSSPEIDQIARALLDARNSGTPADDKAFAGALREASDAYAVQDIVFERVAGKRVSEARAWKSGGPGRDLPLTHAPLLAAGLMQSGASAPNASRFIEAEIALRLARDITQEEAARLGDAHVPALVDAMCVSIELVGWHWKSGDATAPLLKLADFQSHEGLVLGEMTRFRAVDWRSQPCKVTIGSEVHEFRGTHALGDVAWLLPQWLRHATARAGTIRAGTVVTTGTWCGLLKAKQGERVEVEFAGIGKAAVKF